MSFSISGRRSSSECRRSISVCWMRPRKSPRACASSSPDRRRCQRRSSSNFASGFNIYPREIEELLVEQRGVQEAAVVGVPDEIRGEVPVAYIVGDAASDELERVCRGELASFKVPREFIRVESIPRTALGKVQKHLLKR